MEKILVKALKKVVARTSSPEKDSKKAAEKLNEAVKLMKHVEKAVDAAPSSGSKIEIKDIKNKVEELKEYLEEQIKIEEKYSSELYYSEMLG